MKLNLKMIKVTVKYIKLNVYKDSDTSEEILRSDYEILKHTIENKAEFLLFILLNYF